MSARDDLAQLLVRRAGDHIQMLDSGPEDNNHSVSIGLSMNWAAIADIILAAGWRPPTRKIETAEELDALPELTAREHLKAAWKAANPVPPNGRIPKGTKYLTLCGGQDVVTAEAGIDLRGASDIRTLDPLPPLVPDDCMVVRASCEDTPGLGRTIWQRSNDAKTWFALDPADGDWYEKPLSDLINPKPVPEEES